MLNAFPCSLSRFASPFAHLDIKTPDLSIHLSIYLISKFIIISTRTPTSTTPKIRLIDLEDPIDLLALTPRFEQPRVIRAVDRKDAIFVSRSLDSPISIPISIFIRVVVGVLSGPLH